MPPAKLVRGVNRLDSGRSPDTWVREGGPVSTIGGTGIEAMESVWVVHFIVQRKVVKQGMLAVLELVEVMVGGSV